ncbi:MAG TPA: flavin reductase family protein [Acidobacteria bacterium]|nr:flavin reductase family protein [Acidobacteriota bacterium]
MERTTATIDDAGRLLGLVPHGLYLVGVSTGAERFLYTASWLTQASFTPRLIVTAVRRDHRGHRLIGEAGAFAVSFLGRDRQDLAEHGFRAGGDRLEGLPWHPCPVTGAPVVEAALGYLGCRVVRWLEGGDHDLVLAEVVTGELFNEDDLLTVAMTPWSYGG